jgi:hypothetical protein
VAGGLCGFRGAGGVDTIANSILFALYLRAALATVCGPMWGCGSKPHACLRPQGVLTCRDCSSAVQSTLGTTHERFMCVTWLVMLDLQTPVGVDVLVYDCVLFWPQFWGFLTSQQHIMRQPGCFGCALVSQLQLCCPVHLGSWCVSGSACHTEVCNISVGERRVRPVCPVYRWDQDLIMVRGWCGSPCAMHTVCAYLHPSGMYTRVEYSTAAMQLLL